MISFSMLSLYYFLSDQSTFCICLESIPWIVCNSFLLLTLNAPITTEVVCFSRLLKCLRSLYGKQCGSRTDCSYRRRVSGAVKRDFRTYIRRYTYPDEMNNIMVIPILMPFCSLSSNWSVASHIKPHFIQRNMTILITSNYYRQSIAGYTVAYFLRYPIKRRVTNSSALESVLHELECQIRFGLILPDKVL